MLRLLAVWPSFGFGLHLPSDSRLQMTDFTARFCVDATRGSLATHSSVVQAELPRSPQLSWIINLHQIPNTERWKALFNKAGKHFQQQRKTKRSLRRQRFLPQPHPSVFADQEGEVGPSCPSCGKGRHCLRCSGTERFPWISLCVLQWWDGSQCFTHAGQAPCHTPVPDANMFDEPSSSQIWSFNLTVIICSTLWSIKRYVWQVQI